MKTDPPPPKPKTHAEYIQHSATDRPIYIDIDGTLTKEGQRMWGEVIPERIARVRALLAEGKQVVIWSGGGTAYAEAFALMYEIRGAVCVGKPELCVDDNPTIRPNFHEKIVHPRKFFDG